MPSGPAPAAAGPNAPPKPPKAPKHSSKFGTVNYSVDEMRRLNDKVRAVLPITSDEWLHVTYQFNYMRPESIPYREVDSLKRKFKKMYCSRGGGGNGGGGGALPAYVQEAKRLRKMINQRSEHTQLQETEGGAAPAPAPAPAMVQEQQGDEATEGGGTTVEEDGGGDGEGDGEEGEKNRRTRRMVRAVAGAPMPPAAEISASTAVDGAVMPVAVPTPMATAMPSTSGWLVGNATTDLNAGIINLLKHSIERKRRTIEEQILSESERVRKERKKRKMEQVFYNIHREHESVTGGSSSAGSSGNTASPGGGSSDPPSIGTPIAAGVGGFIPAPQPTSSSFGSIPAPGSASVGGDASLPLMEMLLQFMIAQQQEVAQQRQADEERRRKEVMEREQRRRAKELQRKRDKQEMMMLMAALLKNEFPMELRHYLVPVSDGDNDNIATALSTDTAPDRPNTADNRNGTTVHANATEDAGLDAGGNESTRASLYAADPSNSSGQVSIAVDDTVL